MSVANLSEITIALATFATCVPYEDLSEHGARSIPVSSPDSGCQTGHRLLNSPAHSCLCVVLVRFRPLVIHSGPADPPPSSNSVSPLVGLATGSLTTTTLRTEVHQKASARIERNLLRHSNLLSSIRLRSSAARLILSRASSGAEVVAVFDAFGLAQPPPTPTPEPMFVDRRSTQSAALSHKD
ncbi:hypothetical protein LIA77_05614 [Sarocladium implicatum]|nr:hypothetical protein LIA77_05614 [Sarocladium implicatum]